MLNSKYRILARLAEPADPELTHRGFVSERGGRLTTPVRQGDASVTGDGCGSAGEGFQHIGEGLAFLRWFHEGLRCLDKYIIPGNPGMFQSAEYRSSMTTPAATAASMRSVI